MLTKPRGHNFSPYDFYELTFKATVSGQEETFICALEVALSIEAFSLIDCSNPRYELSINFLQFPFSALIKHEGEKTVIR